MTATKLTALKDRSPRWSKDIANVLTRRYGMATARWRPTPDFIIIGTKRGGTTSMWNWLVEHPGVLPMFPAPRGLKSTDFFFDGGRAGERWYRSHFHSTAFRAAVVRRRGHPVVTGEASPLYMYDPRVCSQVSQLMPQVKVIIQLRNPVKRAVSHWQERVNQGVEPLSFSDALAAEAKRTHGQLERMMQDPSYYSQAFDWYSYRDRGVYRPQVERWLMSFPPERVMIVHSEEFSRDTQLIMDQVSDFLGIPHCQRPAYTRHNESSRVTIDPGILRDLGDFYRPHNRDLYALLGKDYGWDD
jgi:hypothetical protein